jgi:asparagine synthase (glutamine-hydrolysing)
MCGLSGILSYEQLNPDQEQILLDMAEAQHHRGPDSRGFALFDQAMFAHNRLSLIDLHERANQPMRNGRYVLIYNGEIYNFPHLKQQLTEAFDPPFAGTSDTEVLFYALIHWGVEKTLRQIKGMFAFAFYDISDRKVWIARDRIGIKPLFYAWKQGICYFASELKALVVALKDLQLSRQHFMHGVTGALENTRRYTAFENVHQLEPGHYLEFHLDNPKSCEDHCYFETVDWIEETEWNRLNRSSFDDVYSEFEHLFTTSVRSMIVADAGMGAFVSGGIDSSLNAAVAKKFRDINLYTANVKGKFSEFTYARQVAEHLGSQLHTYDFEPDMFIRDWVKTTWYYESPLVVHPSAAPFQNVAALTAAHKDKAVITGEGADELFLGYPRLLTRRYDALIQFPQNIVSGLYRNIPGLKRYLNLENTSYWREVGKMAFNYERLINETRHERAYGFIANHDHYEDQLLSPAMVESSLHSLLWRNDRMGMMHSIESRFPFLDDDVMKFGLNLPVKYKIGRTSKFYNWKHPFLIDKWLVRCLGQNYLPKSIVFRKKEGFPMYGQMFLKVDEGFFQNGFWQAQMKMQKDAISYMCSHSDPYMLAKLASVEIWGRLFVYRHTIEAVEEQVRRYSKMDI